MYRLQLPALFLLVLMIFLDRAAFAAELVIRLEPAQGKAPARFVVAGIPSEHSLPWQDAPRDDARWSRVFGVYVLDNGNPVATAMLGEYELEKDQLTFLPRFPLRAGVSYRAVYAPQRWSDEAADPFVTTDFMAAPRPRTEPTRLTKIYPTQDVLPENLLKFYLHFSAPMSRGEAYQRIRLFDENGNQVAFPFLELSEELWDPNGKRLTLYFDPGRIKRGLKPRELFGPALSEGKSYTLVVDQGWPDAQGQSLHSPVKKRFKVVAPDDQQPAASRWRVRPPRATTKDPLVIQFDEPLDSAMLQRVLAVETLAGEPVPGTIELGASEVSWSFRPEQPWKSGDYHLKVDTALEDLAGNSLGRPFEVDVFRPIPTIVQVQYAEVPFIVR